MIDKSYIKTSELVLVQSRWRSVYLFKKRKYVMIDKQYIPLSSINQKLKLKYKQNGGNIDELMDELPNDLKKHIQDICLNDTTNINMCTLNKARYSRFISHIPDTIKEKYGNIILKTDQNIYYSTNPEIRDQVISICKHADTFTNLFDKFWEGEDEFLLTVKYTLNNYDDDQLLQHKPGVKEYVEYYNYGAVFITYALLSLFDEKERTLRDLLFYYIKKGKIKLTHPYVQPLIKNMIEYSDNMVQSKHLKDEIQLSRIVEFFKNMPLHVKVTIGI